MPAIRDQLNSAQDDVVVHTNSDHGIKFGTKYLLQMKPFHVSILRSYIVPFDIENIYFLNLNS